MYANEKAVGNYTKKPLFKFNPGMRKRMVSSMEDINNLRGYKMETFILGVNIADHYLMKLASDGKKAPNQYILGSTALFIAAKYE